MPPIGLIPLPLLPARQKLMFPLFVKKVVWRNIGESGKNTCVYVSADFCGVPRYVSPVETDTIHIVSPPLPTTSEGQRKTHTQQV